MKKTIAACVLMLLCAAPAMATDEDSCSQECTDGKVSVGYGDGNKATCHCVEPGSGMAETVPEAAENPTPDQEDGAAES